MLSRFLLILAGLFVGLWLRGTGGFLSEVGLPSLALLALILAVAAAPRATLGESRARMEEAFREWLDAWQRLRMASEAERETAMQALRSASHRILLTANDRVIRSMQAAAEEDFSAAAVAKLIIDMRRSVGRVSVTLRAEQLQGMVGPTSPKPGERSAQGTP